MPQMNRPTRNLSAPDTAMPTETLPDPPSAAAAAAALDVWALLAAPFDPAIVEIKPGAVQEEKKSALALAYVDARHYQARLDSVFGPAGWVVAYRPWGDRAVICALTINDITREDVGEAEKNDPNQATSAAMQAFKRACAAFGLGRYLYTDLPQLWAPVEPRGRSWAFVDAANVVRKMYHQAGIDLSRRAQLIGRIGVLLGGLDEEGLIRVGKCAANK